LGKKYIVYRSTSVRGLATFFLIVIVVFGGVFFVTRHSSVWRGVPGLNRLSQVSLADNTTRARLINTQITLRAIDPARVSIKDTLVGWGWDNYIYAWEKFYDPSIYLYDNGIFDRAHDFLLDRIVMTGVLGFLSYMFVWGLLIWYIVKIGKRDLVLGAMFLFFAVSFFVQNLSAFDTIITYVAFFAVVAYAIHEHARSESDQPKPYDRKK